MKKRNLATLAMIGISAGLVVGGCQKKGWGTKETKPEEEKSSSSTENQLGAAEHMTSDMQSFYDSLSPEAKKQFNELDAHHKMMAIEKSKGSTCSGPQGCGSPPENPNKAVETEYMNQKSGK